MAYSSYYAGYSKQITLYLHLTLNAQVLCCYMHKREYSVSDLGFACFIFCYSIVRRCELSRGRHLHDVRREGIGLAGDCGLQSGLLQKAWFVGSGTSVWVWPKAMGYCEAEECRNVSAVQEDNI